MIIQILVAGIGIILILLGSYGVDKCDNKMKEKFTIDRVLALGASFFIMLSGVMLLASLVPIDSLIKLLASMFSS